MGLRQKFVDILSGGELARATQQIELLKASLAPRHFLEDNNLPYREDSYRLVNGEDFLTLYENHVPVYACVDAIARNCAKVPMKIYKKALLEADVKKHEAEVSAYDKDEVGRTLWELFAHPNPWQSNFEFRYAIMATAELTGMAYVEKTGKDPQQKVILPEQLWVLRTDWMRAIPSQTELIEKYNYQTSTGAYVEYLRNEIFEYKYWHPRSEFYGLSPVRPAQNSVIIDLYCIKYAKQFFKNGGHISKYVSIKEKLGEQEFKRMASEIQTFMGGLENAHKIPLLEGGGELKEIGEDPEGAALPRTRSMNLDDICQTFGVPPIILGLPNQTHYNNADVQKKVFYEETVIPKNQKLLCALNQAFFEPLGYVMDFDYSDVDVLQPNIEKKANTSAKLISAHIMTPNEVRKEFWQLDPIEGGDEFPVSTTQGLPGGGKEMFNADGTEVAATEDTINFAAPAAKGDAGISAPLTLNGAQITAALQVIQDFNLGAISQQAAVELLVAVGLPRDRAVTMTAQRMSAAPAAAQVAKILKALKEQKDGMTTSSMAAAMPAGTMAGEQKPKREFINPKAEGRYHAHIKKAHVAHADKLYNTIYPVMETAVLNGWKSLQKATIEGIHSFKKSAIVIRKDYVQEILGIMDNETLKMAKELAALEQEQIDKIIAAETARTGVPIPPEKLAALKEKMAKTLEESLAKSMKSVSKTQRARVQSRIEASLEEGKSPGELADEINGYFDKDNYAYAKTVARTETIKYVNTSKMEALNGMGFTSKQWFHSGHEDARADHLAADGEIVDMDELFSTGLLYPGDPDGDAEDVVNCGCTFAEAVGRISDEEAADLGWDEGDN